MSHDSSLLPKIVRQPCATSCCIKHRTSLPLSSCSSQSDSRSAVTIHPFPFPLPNPFPNPSLSPLLFLSPSLFLFRADFEQLTATVFRKTDSCSWLAGTATVASFKLIVRPNAKINFFTSFQHWQLGVVVVVVGTS